MGWVEDGRWGGGGLESGMRKGGEMGKGEGTEETGRYNKTYFLFFKHYM